MKYVWVINSERSNIWFFNGVEAAAAFARGEFIPLEITTGQPLIKFNVDNAAIDIEGLQHDMGLTERNIAALKEQYTNHRLMLDDAFVAGGIYTIVEIARDCVQDLQDICKEELSRMVLNHVCRVNQDVIATLGDGIDEILQKVHELYTYKYMLVNDYALKNWICTQVPTQTIFAPATPKE